MFLPRCLVMLFVRYKEVGFFLCVTKLFLNIINRNMTAAIDEQTEQTLGNCSNNE